MNLINICGSEGSSLALEWCVQGAPTARATPSMHKGETKAASKETSFAEVTRQDGIFVVEIRTQNSASTSESSFWKILRVTDLFQGLLLLWT